VALTLARALVLAELLADRPPRVPSVDEFVLQAAIDLLDFGNFSTAARTGRSSTALLRMSCSVRLGGGWRSWVAWRQYNRTILRSIGFLETTMSQQVWYQGGKVRNSLTGDRGTIIQATRSGVRIRHREPPGISANSQEELEKEGWKLSEEEE